jgi:indole-3-glycerol phosphate synthase
LIEGIIESSKARGFEAAPWVPGIGRDLIISAKNVSAKGKIPIIAEIKPKTLGRPLSIEEVADYARIYEQFDACAISVLTEPTHFMGSLKNVEIARRTGLPILRKDFIFDERQLKEIQADLVLLIAALDIDLNRFIDQT